MATILITGANRGIGLEFVRQYAAEGHTVIATCRNPIGVGELSTLSGDIQVHGLDVANSAQLSRLASDLDGTSIDVLINNAGVYGPRAYAPEDADWGEWHGTLEINAMAPLAVSCAFTPHVKAAGGKIATLTSKMGSMADNTSGGSYIYRSSKAALNAVMKSLANDLRGQSIPVVVLHPGWVQTDMGGPSALIDVQTSVRGMRNVIEGLSMSTTGKFYNYDGTEVPW